MKLLVVLNVKEYQRKVTALLEEAGVNRFSVADIAGHKRKKEASAGLHPIPTVKKRTPSFSLVLQGKRLPIKF